MESKVTHLMNVPFTGLGKYNGFRGNTWLKNRIKIFKHFVIPSLENQTSKNFILWCSWRPEEKNNRYVKELIEYLEDSSFKTIHTFNGVCFWDDKYDNEKARERLVTSIHGSMGTLVNALGECEYVLMTIQPSDDLYHEQVIESLQRLFDERPEFQGAGFNKGYICNYQTKKVANYDPNTNPPFYTIKFPREVFIDPFQHLAFTSLKKDVGKYKKGTPIPSHEFLKDVFGDKYASIDDRGFMVGVHGSNISTTWQIPFKGELVDGKVLENFGIEDAKPLEIKVPLVQRLPHKIQRKLRYWMNEKFV